MSSSRQFLCGVVGDESKYVEQILMEDVAQWCAGAGLNWFMRANYAHLFTLMGTQPW